MKFKDLMSRRQPANIPFRSVQRRPSGGATHIGRGGGGNVFKAGSEDAEKAKHAQQHDQSAVAEDGSSKEEGLAAKGRNFLFGKKQH